MKRTMRQWLVTARTQNAVKCRKAIACAAAVSVLLVVLPIVQPIEHATAQAVSEADDHGDDEAERIGNHSSTDDDAPRDADRAEPDRDAPADGRTAQDADGSPIVRRPGRPDVDTARTTPKVVRVVDEQEQPVVGAIVRIGWWEDEEGDMLGVVDVSPPVTNAAGEVTIHVPRGAVRARISAQADEYANAGAQYSLSGEPTLRLEKGRIVRVRAVDVDGKPLRDAIPILEDSSRWPREFESVPDQPGLFSSPVVELDRRWMRVVDGGGDGPILFSDLIDVTAPEKMTEDGAILAVLRQGIRLEGRLDDSVPRPIEIGCVELYIREGQGHRIHPSEGWTWQDTARVEQDGSFVFESLPAGGHVQLVALLDGHQSQRPTAEALRTYLQTHDAGDPEIVHLAAERNDAFWPHLFPLPPDQETIEVSLPCTATSSIDVKVINPLGQPIEGAEVLFNPNGYFLGGNLFIPGTQFFTEANQVRSDARERMSAIRAWAQSRFLRVASDEGGVAPVRNLPADQRESYRVEADGYVMPIHPTSADDRQSRFAIVELVGGQTLRRTITMERLVPRTARELLIVDRTGRPLPEINVTVTEIAFEGDEEHWHLWAVQRFGTVASATTESDGIVRLDAPVEADDRKVARLRVVVKGRVDRLQGRDAYVQRDRLELPVAADGGVIAITVSDDEPSQPNAFYAAKAEYLDPNALLTESPKVLLERLVKSPSLLLLKQLLHAADFDAAAPLNFAGHRNLLGFRRGTQSPIASIDTVGGQRVVVLCTVRPKDAPWEVKPELAFPPEAAFVFDPSDGSLIAMLGGWASARGDYCSVMLINLGGTDDYFVMSAAFEEHGSFRYLQHWHHLGREQDSALTTYGYANATSWNGEEGPAQPLAEFGFIGYDFNGENLPSWLPGTLPSGALAPRKIYWDGALDRFIGPLTQSIGDRSLYEVVPEESLEYRPLLVDPTEMVVAGGRRSYENWHRWDVVIPSGKKGLLQLLLVNSSDDATEEELDRSMLAPGLHDLQLQIRPVPDNRVLSAVEIRVDPKNTTAQPSHRIPHIRSATDSSIPGQVVARTSRRSMDLLNRSTVKQDIRLVWRVTIHDADASP